MYSCGHANQVNPLRHNSDLSQTSHCNIKGLSVREVMRIENMITQQPLSNISVRNVWKDKTIICDLILGLKGFN